MDSETRIVRFLLTGDSRGALRAQDEAEKGFEKTGKTADDTSKHVGLLSKAFGGMKNVIGYGAGALGLGTVVFGLKDVVQGGKQWQEQQAQLQNALRNTGELSKSTMRQANQAIEHSSTHGGFSPVEEARGLTQLINVTGKYSTAVKLNASAVNLARGAHIEYSAALKLVARAQAGTAGRAQQYLGIIQPVKTYVDQLTEAQKKQNPELLRHAELLDKQATAMEINRVVLEKYKGATQAYSKTASGAMNNFKNLLDVITERIGRKLLPIETKAFNFLSHLAQGVMRHWTQISAVLKVVFAVIGAVIKVGIGVIASIIKWTIKYHQIVEALAIGVGAVVIPILAYNGAMALATIATTAWGASIEFAADMLFLLTSPVSLIVIGIAALVAGVVYAYMHFKTFREVVNAVFGAVKRIVLDAVGFIKQHWEILLATFALPLFALVEVIKHFKQLKTGVESIFHGIGSFVSTVFDGIVNGVIKGVNLIIKAINLVIKGYNAIPSVFKPTNNIKTIGELGEVGKTKPDAHTQSDDHHPAAHRGRDLHVHLHIGSGGGRELAEAIVRDPGGARTLTEGMALYTKKLQARA
jgi:hypothetical protein